MMVVKSIPISEMIGVESLKKQALGNSFCWFADRKVEKFHFSLAPSTTRGYRKLLHRKREKGN